MSPEVPPDLAHRKQDPRADGTLVLRDQLLRITRTMLSSASASTQSRSRSVRLSTGLSPPSFPGVTGCVTQRQRPGPLAPGLSLSTGPEPERLLRSHLQRAIIVIPKPVQGSVTVGPRRYTMRLVGQTKVRSHAAGAAPWRQAGDVSVGSLLGLQYRYSNATRPPAPVTSM